MPAEVVGIPNGFKFGAMTVEATADFNGTTVVTLRGESGQKLEVYCSRTGRSLRVFKTKAGQAPKEMH